MSVQFVSLKRIKARVQPTIDRHPSADLPCVEKRYQQEHPRLVSTFNTICEVTLDEPGFWISKPWLRGKRIPEPNIWEVLILPPPDWRLARPKMHIPYQDDPAPDGPEYDAHVRCEHGGLCPNIAHRRRISGEGGRIIRSLYPSWNPPSTDVGVCTVCQALIFKSQESNRGLRKQAEEEKVILIPITCFGLTVLDTESLETHVRIRLLESTITPGRRPTMYYPRRVHARLETMAPPTDRIPAAALRGHYTPVL